MNLHELIPILQIAIGPVILISGVGLLLLSMTNRFGRVIDRTREITETLRSADGERRASAVAQLEILLKRAEIVRAAIGFAGLSALLAAVLVILLFVSAVLDLDLASAVAGLFAACMASLIVALGCFMSDINLSLVALKLEVRSVAPRVNAR